MPRSSRIQYAGACYHVMNRGAQRRSIFSDDRDRWTFLGLVGESCERFELDVFAYCLMGNHYHLYLRTREANLGRAMQHLDGVYTQRVNRRLGVDGPLFRGRYRSVLVDSDRYSAALARYIHRNPVEAGIVADPGHYPWSSFQALTNRGHKPRWLTGHLVLEEFATVADFRRHTEDARPDHRINDFYSRQRLGPILGSDRFAEHARSQSKHAA